MREHILQFRGDDTPDLGAVLSELKRTGCAIMVAGESRVAREAMSQRLFGSPTVDRHRVLVTPSEEYPTEPWLPNGVDRNAVETISVDSPDRSVAVSAAPDGSELDRARDRLVSVIEASPYELDPGALRVGVHTAAGLTDAHGKESTRSFLEGVFETVRSHRGMGHVHLGTDPDADLFGMVKPLVDGIVEVRFPEGSQPQQRWYIPEYGYTNWVLISPHH
jgi:hypothetical protein